MFRVSFPVMTIVASVAALPVQAADIYSPAPAPAPAGGYELAPATPTWSGAYVGGATGYTFGSVRNKVTGTKTRSTDTQGALGTVFGGVNAQVGPNFVVGAEADATLSSLSGTTVQAGRGYRSDSDFNATVRGRVGTAVGRFLPYATGGLAFVDNTVATKGGTASSVEMGWAAGAGVEGMVTDRITGRVEYMYLGVGESKHKVGGRTVASDPSTNMLRAGAAYKF